MMLLPTQLFRGSSRQCHPRFCRFHTKALEGECAARSSGSFPCCTLLSSGVFLKGGRADLCGAASQPQGHLPRQRFCFPLRLLSTGMEF